MKGCMFRARRGAGHSAVQKLVELPGGFGIAAYALRRPGQRRHVAYAKAFVGVALDYWEVGNCFAKFGSEGDHDNAEAAIEDVLQVALMSLANIGFVPSEYASLAEPGHCG